MRRLAASDSTIDLISMDVIWTAEFGEAGWVKPWPRQRADQISQGVIPAVLQTGQYRGRMYGAPLDATSQLLWYRKDLVPNPPQTWEEMLRVAESLPAGKNAIEVQAAKYEGYTVWFNSLLASAGGSILDDQGKVGLADRRPPSGAESDEERRDGEGRRPVDLGQPGGSGSARVPGRDRRLHGQLHVRLHRHFRQDAPNIFNNLGVALWPRVDPNEPSHVSLGGFNIGVGSHGQPQVPGVRGGQCLVASERQICVRRSRTDCRRSLKPCTRTRRFREAYPYADLLLESIGDRLAATHEPSLQRHLACRAGHAAPAGGINVVE